MKIGIDGTPLATPYPTGTRNYAENLLNALAEVDKKNEYLIFSPTSVRIPKQKNFKVVYIPKIPVLKKQVLLPFLVNRNKVDVFHFLEPFGSIFLKHPRIVTTVHDVDLNQTYPYKSRHFINRIYCELTRWMLARHSKSFITDTRTIGKELRKYLDILKIKSTIETIYLSPDKIFKPNKNLKIKQNYFLCMGDFALRKNIQIVISGYLGLSKHIKDSYKLKIITSTKESAKKFNHLIKKNRYGHKYIEVLINVSSNNLRDLYSNATVFIYPSLYEGFGLPILEAMACGCPVITSNFGAMKEVAGSAALLVNSRFSNNIANTMFKIIDNKKLRLDLVNRGIRRAKEYSWIKTAQKTLFIYEKANKDRAKFAKYKFKFIHLIFISFFVALTAFLLNTFGSTWPTFITKGQIASQIYESNGNIVFGTNHSQLYFLDKFDSNKVSVIDLNSGNPVPQGFYGNKILVSSDDTLRLINLSNKKIIWQVSTNNQYFFKKAEIYKNLVIAASDDGLIQVFHLSNGKLLWSFSAKKVEQLSSIVLGGNLNFFGNFAVNGKMVYYASSDKTLYALDLYKGSLIWKTDIGDFITIGPQFFGKYLYIGTAIGEDITINKITGKTIWQKSEPGSVVCSEVFPNLEIYNNPLSQLSALISVKLQNLFVLGKVVHYELREDGTVIMRNAKNGNMVWKSEKLGRGMNCPRIWKSKIFITGNDGSMILLSSANGKKLYEDKRYGQILTSPIIEPRFGSLIPKWLDVFSPNFYINNTKGDIWKIRSSTLKKMWKFSALAPTNTVPLVDNKNIYFATTDGLIYKLDKKSGQPNLDNQDSQFKVSESIVNVSGRYVHEFTLESKGFFSNPWREGVLDATFTHESGKVIQIPGFYYDKNLWKIRFNPPLQGKWNWKIKWASHGKDLFNEGELVSKTDTSNFYLHTTSENLKRLTLDDKNVFNGVGLGDVFTDGNYNGTPFDDWAVANSTLLIATSSAGITNYYRSNKINTTHDYLEIYGPNGAGFNMFRWSIMNASQSLWTDFGYPTTYSILQGKIGDNFVESLRNSGIHIWFTMFGFDIPYRYSESPVDHYLLKSYIRYVFARYGAYIDIWELANEVAVPPKTREMLVNEIRLLDYEKRPISVSSDDYNVNDGDIVAPHWYETEQIENSDKKTMTLVQNYGHIEKPVIFAEQGNKLANWDSTSAVRMRIRLWTAFFNQAIIIFWNQSDSKDVKSDIFSSNLYIGEEERGYVKVLQSLTNVFPLKSTTSEYNLENYGVRGYGLSSDTLNAGYFYHFTSPFTNTSFVLTINTKSGGNVKWVDPSTGKTTNGGYCSPGNCYLISPIFKTDIAVFVKSIDNTNK